MVTVKEKASRLGGFFLHFWELCAILTMVLPINGKRAALHRICGGRQLLERPPTLGKEGSDYGYILGNVPVLYTHGQCYQPRY